MASLYIHKRQLYQNRRCDVYTTWVKQNNRHGYISKK